MCSKESFEITVTMAPKSSEASRKSTERAWEALTPALSEWILDAVASMGLKRPTPVQASTIPLFAGNKYVVVEVYLFYQQLYVLKQ